VSLVPGEEPFTEVEHYKPLIKHVLALEEHLGDSLIQEAVQLRAQRSCFPLLGVNSTDQGAYVQAIAPLVEHFDADSIVVINRATMEFDRTPAGSQSILLAEALSEKYHECTSINSPSVVVIFVDEILGTQGAVRTMPTFFFFFVFLILIHWPRQVGLRNVTTSTQSKEAKRSRTTSSAYSRSAELSAQLAFTSASKSSISFVKI
jgi:RNase H-fold protein (predicted Holliday junction resolvase)